MAEPERRPTLLDEEPVVFRRGGSRLFPPLPSESELLLFFFGSRSLRHGGMRRLSKEQHHDSHSSESARGSRNPADQAVVLKRRLAPCADD